MDNRYAQPFVNSVQNIVMQMADLEVEVKSDLYAENEDLVSLGVTSIINFIGNIKGRLLLDMEPALAMQIAKNINQEDFESVKDMLVMASISEMNNIIAGDANTTLNNEFELKLRLAPPIVFTGKNAIISIPRIPSVSIDCNTTAGRLKVNIAFEGGQKDGN